MFILISILFIHNSSLFKHRYGVDVRVDAEEHHPACFGIPVGSFHACQLAESAISLAQEPEGRLHDRRVSTPAHDPGPVPQISCVHGRLALWLRPHQVKKISFYFPDRLDLK